MSTAAVLELNLAQQDVIDQLGSNPDDRPEFDRDLRHHLRQELSERLQPVVGELPDGQDLNLSKHLLSQVHGCEVRFLAQDDAPFEVSVPIARGSVVHKAVELSIHWPTEPDPLDLVDEALDRLTRSDHWLADWLQTCSDADRAELRGESNALVVKFLECWPRLKPGWRPATEQSYRVDLCDDRVHLRGKVDLALGRTVGQRAGKVIVDFKSGGFNRTHYDDLRFYALIDTLRLGAPPRRLASYYVDSATMRAEDVTAGVLEAAVARTVDGAATAVALRQGRREPVARPSFACRWCSELANCPVGTEFLVGVDGA